MRFTKMNGLGNDFVVVDGFATAPPEDPSAVARRLCDRKHGVGADGLVLVLPDPEATARMIIVNADGSRADSCGNALRCVALLLAEAGRLPARGAVLRTDAGPVPIEAGRGPGGEAWWTTAVGHPEFERARIPMLGPPGRVVDEPLPVASGSLAITALRVGNPHAIHFVADPDDFDLAMVGPLIERHPAFPARTNLHVVALVDRARLRQRSFERGVGETLACGTGAAASGVAAILTRGAARELLVEVRGGVLGVAWPGPSAPVSVSGPAAVEFESSL